MTTVRATLPAPWVSPLRASWSFVHERALTLTILLLLLWVVGAPVLFLLTSSFRL